MKTPERPAREIKVVFEAAHGQKLTPFALDVKKIDLQKVMGYLHNLEARVQELEAEIEYRNNCALERDTLS